MGGLRIQVLQAPLARLVRIALSGLAALAALPHAAHTQDHAAEIIRICEGGKAPDFNAAIDSLVRENKSWFENADPENFDTHEAVAKYEALISRTSYAWLLQCPARLEAMGIAYNIKFDAKDMWYVKHDRYDDPTFTMGITKSREYVISQFTYLHEMVHVCQRAEWLERDQRDPVPDSGGSQVKPPSVVAADSSSQASLLGEIEAFHAMQMAYRELLRQSTALCLSPRHVLDPYRIYADGEVSLRNGSFAQRSSSGYYEKRKYDHRIYDLAAPPYFFADRHCVGADALMRPFSSEFQTKVEELGISVRYGTEEPTGKQLACAVQRRLKEAECYSGEIDGAFGRGSRTALERFSKATDVQLPGMDPTVELIAAIEKATLRGATCK